MPRFRRLKVLAVVMSVALAACGGGDDEEAAPRATTTAPAADAPTSLPSPPAGTAPLTGLPGDPAKLRRPALIVKIDNAPKARPQVGINQADVVVEEKVEDGVTRLFTLFHSGDADPVGPVRSARSTDVELARPLRKPLFGYSGANAKFLELVRSSPIVDLGADTISELYRRQPGRPAPYNLFSSTTTLFARAPAGSEPPPPLFTYGPAGQPAGAGAAPAGGVRVEYRGKNITTIAEYRWDGGGKRWQRSQDGGAHKDEAGAQVAPVNVIVQFVEYVDTGIRDRSGAAVPEAKLSGSGEAWIFTNGQVVKGRWTNPNPDAITAYTDANGGPIRLNPGQTWVELAPIGASTVL
jgi:hypothetical protein